MKSGLITDEFGTCTSPKNIAPNVRTLVAVIKTICLLIHRQISVSLIPPEIRSTAWT